MTTAASSPAGPWPRRTETPRAGQAAGQPGAAGGPPLPRHPGSAGCRGRTGAPRPSRITRSRSRRGRPDDDLAGGPTGGSAGGPGEHLMQRQIRRLGLALLVAFGVLFLQLNYIQVVRADKYASAPGNTRRATADFSRERGVIQSADGVILARSVVTNDSFKRLRQYP